MASVANMVGRHSQFKEGGERGKCIKHGGYPRCIQCGLNSIKKLGKLCKEYCDPTTIKRRKLEEERIEKLLVRHGIPFRREVHITFHTLHDKEQTCIAAK